MTTFDDQKIQYVSLIKMDGGEPIASLSPCELTVDPDLITGFVTAVIIFARTPIRTIRKAAYDILIQVGETYLVLFVMDPVPDEAPYRERMQQVLQMFERFSIDWAKPSQIHELYSKLTRNDPEWMYFHLLQRLLSSLGLSWMGYLDGNPIEHLKFILPRIDNTEGQTEIYNYVVEKICEQIDDGGTTIGIDIDRMIDNGHLAARIKKVLDKRQSEIADVEVVLSGDSVNLKNLWLTAYGFSMRLQGVGNVGLSCDLKTFNRIQNKLNGLGIKLRVSSSETQVNIPGVSKGMRDYIWTISREDSTVASFLSPKLVKNLMKMVIE